MTPELKAALEQVLSLARDMGDYYHQVMEELMKAFDAEPTDEDQRTSLIESTNKGLLKTIKKQNVQTNRSIP